MEDAEEAVEFVSRVLSGVVALVAAAADVWRRLVLGCTRAESR